MFLFGLFWIVDGVTLLIAASHSLKDTWEVVTIISGIAGIGTGILAVLIPILEESGGAADI